MQLQKRLNFIVVLVLSSILAACGSPEVATAPSSASSTTAGETASSTAASTASGQADNVSLQLK